MATGVVKILAISASLKVRRALTGAVAWISLVADDASVTPLAGACVASAFVEQVAAVVLADVDAIAFDEDGGIVVVVALADADGISLDGRHSSIRCDGSG